MGVERRLGQLEQLEQLKVNFSPIVDEVIIFIHLLSVSMLGYSSSKFLGLSVVISTFV